MPAFPIAGSFKRGSRVIFPSTPTLAISTRPNSPSVFERTATCDHDSASIRLARQPMRIVLGLQFEPRDFAGSARIRNVQRRNVTRIDGLNPVMVHHHRQRTTRVLGINGTENRVKVTRNPQCQSPCAGARGTGSPVWKALSLVFLSTRHFPVQLLAVYRTSILLIIQQITSKNPASPGTSFMFHYRLRCCLRCVHPRLDENSLEFVRTCGKTLE